MRDRVLLVHSFVILAGLLRGEKVDIAEMAKK